MDHIQKEGGRTMVCKPDMEKNYNQVSWDFLMYMMRRFGFGSKWQSWIIRCISTLTFSMLINGTLGSFFKSSKSLRQRDPLSPFLLVHPCNERLKQNVTRRGRDRFASRGGREECPSPI